MGAGTSKCAGLPLLDELTKSVLKSPKLTAPGKAILTTLVGNFAGAKNPNIEDYLSELIDLLAIAERRTSRGASLQLIEIGGSHHSEAAMRGMVRDIKAAIVETLCCATDLEAHREFVRAVHKAVRPGKRAVDQSVDYLVLNYDTLLEDALALEKLPYADGVEGARQDGGVQSPLSALMLLQESSSFMARLDGANCLRTLYRAESPRNWPQASATATTL